MGSVTLFFFQHQHTSDFQVFLSHVVFVLHICIHTQCTHWNTHTYKRLPARRHTHAKMRTTSKQNMGDLPKNTGRTSSSAFFRAILPKHNSRLHGRPERDTQTYLYCLKACGQVEVPHSNALCSQCSRDKNQCLENVAGSSVLNTPGAKGIWKFNMFYSSLSIR